MSRRIIELESVFRDRRNPMEFLMKQNLIVKRYRFSREGIMMITDIVAPDIEHPTRRNVALHQSHQV
jgi:hypothetical protein